MSHYRLAWVNPNEASGSVWLTSAFGIAYTPERGVSWSPIGGCGMTYRQLSFAKPYFGGGKLERASHIFLPHF